jgi:hypothetical protein
MRITVAVPRARGLMLHCLVLLTAAVPAVARAQTDISPIALSARRTRCDRAVAALELQAAPLRWSRAQNARVVWSVEPEPRMAPPGSNSGAPLFITEGFEAVRVGIGAARVASTRPTPSPCFRRWQNAAVAVPAGRFGPRRLYTTVGVLATRTTSLGRVHLNADATQGDAIAADDGRWETPRSAGLEELSRWTAGVAVDRTMPLRSLLIGAELVARRSIREGSGVEWQAATGVRWQLDPRWALDAGLGRTLGDDHEWSLTLGAARSFGLINLIPLSR